MANVPKFTACSEYAGLLPSGALDRTATLTSNAATSIALGPVTTQHNRELVFYYFFNGVTQGSYCDWNDNLRAHTYLFSSVCDFVQYTAGQVAPVVYLPGTGNPVGGLLATFRLSDAPLQVK